jgi:hypothetical protein
MNRRLKHLRLELLDVVDVVVSKLKPFRPKDRNDITAMIDLGVVDHAAFVDRFRSATVELAHTADAEHLPSIVENFHQIEHDLFDVEPSEIELPSWV